MSQNATQKSFAVGDVIMRQGDTGTSAYIIESGRVEILLTNAAGEQKAIGSRGPGAMIGEMAIIDESPRTATVRALEDCTLLEITRDDFVQRIEQADSVLRMATQVILARYRDLLRRSHIIGDPPRSILDVEAIERNYAQDSNAIETIKIRNDFETGLKNGDIRLHYQPIVNLADGKTKGFEALMRWDHPKRGPVSPALFIPIIEDSDLMVKASQWALKEALIALKRLESHTGLNNLFMSVNFSSRDFSEDRFVDGIYEALSKTDAQAHQLHIEITERLLIGQPGKAKDTLAMCRKAGIGISIDDFGTGYSSLSYLHAFSIDTLKIDRSFVMQITKDPGARALVKSIVDLGKNMDMKIIAEGVETETEKDLLTDMGCDMAQGYFFCRPLPEHEVADFVQENR